MSVLIKGMNMPKNCWSCYMPVGVNCPIQTDEEALRYCSCRHKDCPLVYVPPHGRLIDADKVYDQWYQLNFDHKISGGTLAYWNVLLRKAPVIIEAEEGE